MRGTIYDEKKNLLMIHTDLISPRPYPGYEAMKKVYDMDYLTRVANFATQELFDFVLDMEKQHPGLRITEYC